MKDQYHSELQAIITGCSDHRMTVQVNQWTVMQPGVKPNRQSPAKSTGQGCWKGYASHALNTNTEWQNAEANPTTRPDLSGNRETKDSVNPGQRFEQ